MGYSKNDTEFHFERIGKGDLSTRAAPRVVNSYRIDTFLNWFVTVSKVKASVKYWQGQREEIIVNQSTIKTKETH